jgi:hypothetical protein
MLFIEAQERYRLSVHSVRRCLLDYTEAAGGFRRAVAAARRAPAAIPLPAELGASQSRRRNLDRHLKASYLHNQRRTYIRKYISSPQLNWAEGPCRKTRS